MTLRKPDLAEDLAAALDSFLSNEAPLESGPCFSLLEILYNCAVSPVPIDYGPLTSRAGICVCRVMEVMLAGHSLPASAEILFSTNQLGIIQDTCDQLSQETQPIVGVLV